VLKVKKTSSADIGIVVSKKIGNSVKRNKIKRQVKEILRTKSFFENLDYHIAFIAKKNIAISSFDSILYDMKNVAKKIRND
jgi:ribonuclease P protein component